VRVRDDVERRFGGRVVQGGVPQALLE
jgi:hypothetical protein